MKMEMLIEELQEVVDSAITLPLTGGKTVVNTERLKEIIDEMKENIPQEIRQAKNIAADRANILAKARKEAEEIVQAAETRAKEMTERHEITRNAQQSAEEILKKANDESEKIRGAANAYIEKMMKKADDELSANLAQLQKTRQSLQALQNKGQQKKARLKSEAI